jgi:hypothetical protein
MDIVLIISLLAVGGAVGFLAGLLGIGGGMSMVPFMVMLFEARNFPPGEVIKIAPWSEAEVRQLIRARDGVVDMAISVTDLVVTHENEDQYYEVIKTSEGFFRLLHEFCQGNPRVALLFWLRSLKRDNKGQLQVSLFRRPPYAVLSTVTDQYLFTLAAVAQHGGLSAEEASTIIHIDRGFCEMAMNFLHESDIITVDPRTERARISTLYLRAVLKQLSDSNFLYE